MFWALAQREKDRKKWREEALKEGREQGREQGREYERARIERQLAERGIELPPEAIEIIKASHNGDGDVKE